MTVEYWQRLDGRVTFSLPRRALFILLCLFVLIFTTTLIALVLGRFSISVMDALLSIIGYAPSKIAATVILEFRLPRALTAIMAGALLAGSGAILQMITRNALADPSIVGVSQGASLAVVTAFVLFPQTSVGMKPVFAFFGALAVTALIQIIAMRESGNSTIRFILTGIGVAVFLSAIIQTMLTYGDINQASSALAWLAGSIQGADWTDLKILILCALFLLPAMVWAARPVGALRMGHEVAVGLGASVRRDWTLLIIISVALAASAVSVVGPLAFVGLVGPHLARHLARSGPGLHMALSMAAGAALVALADLVGRVAFDPIQLPAGLLTAIIGAPIFGWLLLRRTGR